MTAAKAGVMWYLKYSVTYWNSKAFYKMTPSLRKECHHNPHFQQLGAGILNLGSTDPKGTRELDGKTHLDAVQTD